MDSYSMDEGMVAVITGLKDAALSVTVSDARQSGPRNRQSPGHATSQGRMGTWSSGVQTGRSPERCQSNTQFHRTAYQPVYHAPPSPALSSPTAHASPTRGASNAIDLQHLEDQLNQLRECLLANGQGVSSTSRHRALNSPVRSPSAPIRRPGPPDMPTRQLGMVPVRDVTHRSSGNLHRGPSISSTPSYRRDRASNAFVESLRKYPNTNLAERTVSVDIIQRLLAQTHSKTGSRRTVHVKRVRSLTRHAQEPCLKRASNKFIQTSNRTESPTREFIAAIYGTGRKKKRVLSLEKRDGSPNGRGTVSFECLSHSFAHAHRSTDVRYLSDVTRYVRDTLRQIGNNDDMVCPHMMQRYSAHRREHHQSEASTLTINEPFAQASSSKRPKRVCRFSDTEPLDCRGQSSRNLGDNVRMKMINIKQKLCLICNQPTPCRCDLPPPCPCPENRPTGLKDRLKSIDLCEEFRRLYKQEPIYEVCTCPQDVDEIIDDIVDKWLNNIPIYAGYTYKDKLNRDDIVNTLKINLKQDVGQKQKCEKDISDCLKHLPMWLPPERTDHDKFKAKLCHDLLTIIANIDLFGSKVRRWVEGLPLLVNSPIEKEKIAADLSRKLKDVAMTARDLRNDLIQCTYDELENLPIRVCSCMEKDDLAEKLADSLISLPREVIDNLIHMDDFSSVRKKVELLEKVKVWVYGVPVDTTEILNREEIALDVTEQLNTVVENTEPGELWSAVKKIARRKLEGFKIQGGLTEMEIQASKLADALTLDLFSAVVDKWSKTVAFDHNSNVVRELFAHDLTKKLVSSLEDVDPDEAEEVMKKITSDMLNSLPASGSLSLKFAQASKLANALNKLGSKETSGMKETIKRWIEVVPFEPMADSDKRKIVGKLANNIKNIVDSNVPNEIWHAVKNDTFKEIENIPVTCDPSLLERHAEKLADDIVSFLFDESLKSWIKGIPFKHGLETYTDEVAVKIKKLFQDHDASDNKAADFIKAQMYDVLPDNLLECNAIEKEKLIEGLVDTVKKGPKARDKITMVVENWLKNKVPLTSPVSSDRVNSIVKKIKNKLTSTSTREQWNAIKLVALEELEQIPIDCLPSEMEALAEDLASSLASDNFQETVKEWANNIHFDSFSEEEIDNFTIDLINKLKNVLGARNIEEVRDAMKGIIVDGLVPTAYDTQTKEEEAEKLLRALEKINKGPDSLLFLVENWFKTVPFLPEPPVNKIKVTKRLAKNLKEKLDSPKPESTWNELKAVTKDELGGLPVSGGNPKIEQMAENLANILVSEMLIDTIRNWTKKVPFDPNKNVNKPELVNDLANQFQNILNSTDPIDVNEKLTEVIIATLENLPIICTTSQKTALAEELANAISNIPKEQDQFSQTLHDFVQTSPFDYKDPVDKTKLATDMVNKLKNVVSNEPPENTRDAMNSEIKETLGKYKMKCSDAEKEKLADQLADKLVSDLFSDTVRIWVKAIPLKPTPPVDSDEVSDKLIGKLKPRFAQSKLDKNGIITTIRGELTMLPVDRNPTIKDTYLTQIANELYEKLLKCPPEETEERKRKRLPPPSFAINVNEMLKGVTVSLGADDNEKLVKKTLDKLRTLRSEGRDEAFIRKELKRDIEVGVDELLAGKKTDPQARKNLAKKLYTQVFNTFKDIGDERKTDLIPKFTKSIKDWLVAHSEITVPKNKQEKVIQDLAEKLATEAVGVGTQTDIKNKMMKIIGHTLDTINPTLKDDSNLKNTLIESLTQQVGADIGVIPKESGKKDKKATVFHVMDIKKCENETQADEMIPKKRMRGLAISCSDFRGNRFDDNERDRKLIFTDKSPLVGDLLHSFEKSADIPIDIYEDGTKLSESILRKTKNGIDIIPETPNGELFAQIESGNIIFADEVPYRHDVNKIMKHPQIDIHSTDKIINKMTEPLSNCSSSFNITEMPNISKNNKKYEVTTTCSTLSHENLIGTNFPENVSQNATNKITSLQSQGLDHKQIEYEMVSKNTFEIDNITKNKLADKLLFKLFKTIRSALLPQTKKVKNIKRSSDSVSDEDLKYAIKRDVNEWLNEIAKISIKPNEITVPKTVTENQEISVNKHSTKTFDHRGNGFNTKTKTLGSRAETVVQTVSLASNSISSDDDTEKYLDIIKKEVTDWIKGTIQLCSSIPAEIENIIMTLTKQLAEIDALDLSNIENRNTLRNEIVNKLSYLFKCKGERLNVETKQMLANQLIDSIAQKYHDTVDTQDKQINFSRNAKYKINRWIEHIPELSHSNNSKKKQIKRLTRSLAKKISRLCEQGLNEEETKREMLNIISEKLDIALKVTNKQIDSKRKHILLNELLNNLTSSRSNLAHKNECELIKNIKKDVEEWMESIFETSAKTSEKRKVTEKIIKYLVEILTSSQTICDKEVRRNIVFKIIEELENVYDSTGSIGAITKNKMADKLLDKIIKTAESFQIDLSKQSKNNKKSSDSDENSKNWKNKIVALNNEIFTNKSARKSASPTKLCYSERNLQHELENAFENDVMDWIDQFPELKGTTAHSKENKRIIKDLSKALALLEIQVKEDSDIQKQMLKEIRKQIGKSFYYREKDLDKNVQNKIVNELLQKVIKTANRLKTKTNCIENINEVTSKCSSKVKSESETLKFNLLARQIFHDYLTNWFDEILELQVNDINERKIQNKIFRNLARNLADTLVQNVKKSDIRKRMSMEIKKHLDLITINKSVCLSLKTKDDLTYQLLDQIMETNENPNEFASFTSLINTVSKKYDKDVLSCLGDPNAAKRDEEKIISSQLKLGMRDHIKSFNLRKKYNYVNKSMNTKSFPITAIKGNTFQDSVIWEWVHDMPLLSCTSEKHRKCVGDESHNPQAKQLCTDISRKSNEKDKSINQFSKLGLAKDLQTSTINLRTRNDSSYIGTFLYPAINKICSSFKKSVGKFNTSPSRVFYVEESSEGSVKEISREIDADTQTKIFGLILNDIDSVAEPKDREILKKQIVQILIYDANLPENEAIDLAESILKSAEEQAASASYDEKQLLTLLRNEIKKIMSEFQINKQNAAEIESVLMDLEVRRLFEGKSYEDDDEAKAAILQLIKEKGGLSDEDAKAMLGKLGGNYDNLFLSPTVQKSLMKLKSNAPNTGKLSYESILAFENKATEILVDFFDTYVDYPSPEKQKNIEKVIHETVSKLGDIIESDNNIERQMRDELNKQIRRISLDTAESVTDLVEDVLEDLIDVYKSYAKKTSDNEQKQNEEKLIARLEKYTDGLEKVIEKWLDDLPLYSDDLEDVQFKKTMIKDLAGDVIDRETYLQTHPEIITTEPEERDHLTKKCHIWMKKFLEDDDLKMAMSGTDDLVDAIRGVPVPKLTPDTQSYFDALQDEILKWTKGLPPHIKPTVDDDIMKKHVNDLAKIIQTHKGKPDAEQKIRSAIGQTLPLIYGDTEDAELNRMKSSLFNTLMNKGFTDDTWKPEISDKIPTYMDALQKEILDWAKRLPPHIKPTVDDDTMKKRVNDLAKIIQTHKGKPDAEQKIRLAIGQTLPMIFGDTEDTELNRMESSLFNTLMNKGFTDDTWVPELSIGDKPTYLGALQKEILGWVKHLPPNIKPSVDDDTMKKHVNDLAKIIETLKGKPDAEEKIRSAIGKTLPLIFGDLDGAELKKLETSLFDTLMNKGFTDDTWKPEISDKIPTYMDALQKEILDWAKKLPPHIKPTVDDDTMKKRVNDLAKIIQTHKGKPDAEQKIRSAIGQTLPMIFGDTEDAELNRMESSLFNTLMNKGFTDDTWVPELSIGDKPTYLGALQKEILGWVKHLPPNIKPSVDDDTMKKHVNDLAKIIETLKGKPDAEEKIRSAIGKTLPLIFGDLDSAELKKLETSLFDTLLNKGFTDDTWVPQDASDFNEENLIKNVLGWLKESPMYQKASPEERKQMELAAIEMAKGVYNTIGMANLTPGSDLEKMLHNDIRKHLKDIITDPECKNDENFLNKAADNVLNYLKARPSFQELTGLVGPHDLLPLAIDNWVKTLPIDVRSVEEQGRLNDAKSHLASRLAQARDQFPPSTPQHEQAIRDEARKFLRSNLTDPQKRSDERYIEEEANKLVKLLNMVPITSSGSRSTIKPYKSPADTLYEYIGEWVDNLPVEGDIEKVKLMKQNLASKLINKIGELNMNPDIFNESELYQLSLSDEIDKLLEEIPRNSELDKYLPALKKQLIFQVLDARQKILDELAGKVYKQHLKDTLSTSLPLPGCLTGDEQASLELVKDKLADAFIDLHFSDCEGNEFINYKKKISNELNRFCADISRHYPCARIDAEKVKDDLHRALLKVPIPRDDSMKSEVEQVRIREIVNDWMRDIPLRQETASDRLRRYKLAAVLAKHIHDIEMEKQQNDFIDSEHRIQEETRKFMNIIPIREDREFLIPDLIQKLINKLECSEKSRRFFSSDRCELCQTNEYESPCSQHPFSSTLCTGNQTNSTNNGTQSQACKDAIVCTPLVDSCSQTCHEVQKMMPKKPCMTQKSDATCMTQKESACHFSPRVLVKEYIWDSTGTCTGEEYSPPCLQRSCSQGVQAKPPQVAPEQNLTSTLPGVEQQTSPYHGIPSFPESQHPSMYDATPENIPLRTQNGSFNPYDTYSGFPRQSNQQPTQPPITTERPTTSDCYCPSFQEREIPFKRTQSYTIEDRSEEEWPCAGASRTCRRPYPDCGQDNPCGHRRRPHNRPEDFDDNDFWNACWRHRGRPMSGYRSDKIKGNKCDCKERVWVACKGRRDRFVDMCQACGTTCPHPQAFLFTSDFSKR